MHNNYFAEFTPTVRPSCIPRFHPLEMISFEGLFHARTWDRLFFNELYYDNYSEKEIEETNNPLRKFDLTTESGKNAFEKEVRRYIRLYPGMVVREGEEFDFEAYYISNSLDNGLDLSKYD